MGYLEDNKNLASWILRLSFGVAFLVAGLDKVLGIEAARGMFDALFGLSLGAPMLYLAIVIELIGGLALILGYRVRCAASVLSLFMLVAFAKTFALGQSAHIIGTLREILVFNTGGGNTAVNFAYFVGLASLAAMSPHSEKRKKPRSSITPKKRKAKRR